MKPGARAEWNYIQDHPEPAVGYAESETDASSMAGIAAVLWIPDPEQRHGWREVYVKRSAPKPRGKMGFGR